MHLTNKSCVLLVCRKIGECCISLNNKYTQLLLIPWLWSVQLLFEGGYYSRADSYYSYSAHSPTRRSHMWLTTSVCGGVMGTIQGWILLPFTWLVWMLFKGEYYSMFYSRKYVMYSNLVLMAHACVHVLCLNFSPWTACGVVLLICYNLFCFGFRE